MALSSLSGSIQVSATWNASNNITGSDYQPVSNATSIRKTSAYSSGIANTAEGGADELVSYLITISASANTTINTSSLTNILQQSSINLTKIKGYLFRLLSVDDDSTNGTNCSSVSVGNGTFANQQNLGLSVNSTYTIYNGSAWSYTDERAAGINTVTANLIKILNNDGTNTACVQVTFFGCT